MKKILTDAFTYQEKKEELLSESGWDSKKNKRIKAQTSLQQQHLMAYSNAPAHNTNIRFRSFETEEKDRQKNDLKKPVRMSVQFEAPNQPVASHNNIG